MNNELSSLYSGVIQAVVALVTVAFLVGGLASTWLKEHPKRNTLVPILGALAAVAAMAAAFVLVQIVTLKNPTVELPRPKATGMVPQLPTEPAPPLNPTPAPGRAETPPAPPSPAAAVAPMMPQPGGELSHTDPTTSGLSPTTAAAGQSAARPTILELESYLQQALKRKPGWENQPGVHLNSIGAPAVFERARGVVTCRLRGGLAQDNHTLLPENIFEGVSTARTGEPVDPLPLKACENSIDRMLETLLRP